MSREPYMHRLGTASPSTSVAEVGMCALESVLTRLTLKSRFLGLCVSGRETMVRENCREPHQNSDIKLAASERWPESLLS